MHFCSHFLLCTHICHTNTPWLYSGESSKIKIRGATQGKELSKWFQGLEPKVPNNNRNLKSDVKGSKDALENEKLSLHFWLWFSKAIVISFPHSSQHISIYFPQNSKLWWPEYRERAKGFTNIYSMHTSGGYVIEKKCLGFFSSFYSNNQQRSGHFLKI